MGEAVSVEQIRPKYYYSGDFSPHEALFRRYPHQELTFQKGQTLSMPGVYFDAHFFILSGSIATFYLHCSGNEKQMFIHGPGIVWPLFISQHFEQERNLRICALEETRFLVFDNKTLHTIIDDHRELFPVMMNLARKTMDFLLFDCCNQCFNFGIEKLCNCLYSLCRDRPDCRRDGQGFHLPITQAALRGLIGLNKTNTHKYLSILQQNGILSTGRGEIIVHDLNRLCDFCSPEIIPNDDLEHGTVKGTKKQDSQL